VLDELTATHVAIIFETMRKVKPIQNVIISFILLDLPQSKEGMEQKKVQ